MSEIEIIVAVFTVYLALLTAVAVWSSKASSGMDGYFIAGKQKGKEDERGLMVTTQHRFVLVDSVTRG